MNFPDIQIVEVSLKDLPVLRKVSRKTFHDSFSGQNTPENMKLFLDQHFSTEKLESELLNPDSSFFFAKSGERVMGYLKLNRGNAQTVLPNDQALEIERIYVEQDFKGKGIGQLFIQKAIETATSFHAEYLWLGVWEHNHTALRFYEKNGFRTYGQHLFKVGDDPQTDLLLKWKPDYEV